MYFARATRGVRFSGGKPSSCWMASAIRSSAACLLFSRPSSLGYVVLFTSMSLPAVLPSISVVWVQSRISSTTWNARPMLRAYLRSFSTVTSSAPPTRAPHTTDASSRAAVLCSWMYCSTSRPTSSFSLLMSTTCPPVSPSAPTALPSSRITRSTRSGEVPVVARATCSKAKESRASPARMAMSSPYTLWLVGRPLRKSSLSMEGKSSWIRLMVCTTSMAQAVGIAHAMSPPTNSQAAKVRAGRTRLPPARSEYLMASSSTSGWRCGSALSSASFTMTARSIM
mmetsp:Transcript_1823/g.4667  ORF Transcript_1823/g.4667 Transcript_1823/m.4667 type:complete len:283 (-) Transcript_1823:482-1330(-)